MLKCTQKICLQIVDDLFGVFGHFVGLALKGLKCMAQRFVRLLFNFTCSFVFILSLYYDVNLFELFLQVSTFFCLPIGEGTQRYQDVGGTATQVDIRRKWRGLKSRGYHDIAKIKSNN